MLELKHISYRVSTPDGEQDILKDISITIPDEKLVVFTGPNGGGKTTMAKVIMGLAEPTSGQILYNGQDITHLSITVCGVSGPGIAFCRSTTGGCCFWRRARKSSLRTSAAST
jgi:ABC-type cobalamin/Fe3+-siderophores transport system ATPase subunit